MIRLATIPVVLVLCGCASTGSLEPAGERVPYDDGGERLGVVAIDDSGVSAPLGELRSAAGEALGLEGLGESLDTLWVGGAPGRCFTLGDADGSPLPRVDPIEEAGLLLFAPEATPTPASLRLVVLDCVTRRPLAEAAELELRRPVVENPASEEDTAEEDAARPLPLRLVLSEHSALQGDDEAQAALLAALRAELAPAGIVPELVALVPIAGVDEELVFGPGALAPLQELLDLAGPATGLRGARTVDIVVAGCLRYDDPFFPPSVVEGFTPRVVGGGGPLDAVFVPGRVCDSFREDPAPVDIDALAHTLAHELAHFLGLRHTVERDGSEDGLDDTDAENLMNARPSLAIARGLSESQVERMRAHPFVSTR